MIPLEIIGRNAKEAATLIAKLKPGEKNEILCCCAKALKEQYTDILEANQKDVALAKESGMKESLIDRLSLNKERVDAFSDGLVSVSLLDDPIGEVLQMKTLDNGLTVGQKRVPMGVIGMIYESRPNVTVDVFGLCLKAGSAGVLRGSKDAICSNRAIVAIIRNTLRRMGYSENFVQLIDDTDRNTTLQMMKLNRYIDLLVPRGGAGLIQTVVENSTVPVIETGIGNCHIFVDESADVNNAVEIIINAKTQRPGTCNTCETVLVHENIQQQLLPALIQALKNHHVEIRGCEKVQAFDASVLPATEEDWYCEFLDLILAVKVVPDVDGAIQHIQTYGSKHSESILSENYTNIQKFLDEVDSAVVYANASTRFTDGFEFGFGAELGISTQKLHARGPMGLKEMTSTKYFVYGNGQIRK